MSYDDVFNAYGHAEDYIDGSFYYVAEWKAPLRVIDDSFDHAFGTQTQYSLEQEIITPEDIELEEVYVLDRNENEIDPAPFLQEIKKACLKQYDRGNYKIEE